MNEHAEPGHHVLPSLTQQRARFQGLAHLGACEQLKSQLNWVVTDEAGVSDLTTVLTFQHHAGEAVALRIRLLDTVDEALQGLDYLLTAIGRRGGTGWGRTDSREGGNG